MIMPTEEIIREYKLAKYKRKQIEILADQNCCSKKDIALLLYGNGLEVDKRFFTKPPKKPDPAAEQEQEATTDPSAVCTLTQQEAYTLVDFIDNSIEGYAFENMPKIIGFVRLYEKLASCGGEEEDG